MVRNNKNNGGNMSNQVMVQVEDVHMVPTPPSVSSSTAITAPSLLPYYQQDKQQPVSPVKPVPERRAVTVTVSTISSETRYEAGDNNYSTSNKTTTLINLNDVPFSAGEGFQQAPTSRQTITTTTVMPHVSIPSSLFNAYCILVNSSCCRKDLITDCHFLYVCIQDIVLSCEWRQDE